MTDEEERYYRLSEESTDSKDSLSKALTDVGGPFPEVNLKIKCYQELPKYTDDAIDAQELLRGNVKAPPSPAP